MLRRAVRIESQFMVLLHTQDSLEHVRDTLRAAWNRWPEQRFYPELLKTVEEQLRLLRAQKQLAELPR